MLLSHLSTQIKIWLSTVQAFTTNLAISILILVVGWLVIGQINKALDNLFKKNRLEPTVKTFLASLINHSLKIILIIAVAIRLGAEESLLLAILGSAGLAIGLALQGSLANFSGGILLLVTKPFALNDFIETQGQKGTVESIKILHTTLLTLDNKVITLPNGTLSNSTITNYSRQKTRRIDLIFGVDYNSSIEHVKQVLHQVVDNHPKILTTPAPTIRMIEQASSSLNYAVRVWSKTEDYWSVYFDLTEQVKEALDAENINIPFPQLDVHMINSSTNNH